jgi:tol-pal system protein YbgF
MRFLILLSILFINYAVAKQQNGIEQKPIIFNQENTYLDKFREYDVEIKNLINKIEILENNLSSLNKRLDNLNAETLVQDNTQKQNVNDVKKISNTEFEKLDSDIFTIKEDVLENDLTNIQKTQVRKLETEKELYDVALAALKEGNYEESQENFLKLIETYPKSDKLSKIYFWYAEVFFRQKLYNEASINYLKSYKQEPKGEKASDALLKLALSLGNSNKKQDACLLLARLQSEFKERSGSSIKTAIDANLRFECNHTTKGGTK